MTEKQIHNPEANSQMMDELYQQAADYLETMLHHNQANVKPTAARSGNLVVEVDVPELDGKRLHLSYERASQKTDPTQVDREVPLAWTDESGINRWHTPIGIKVYGDDGSLLHDYDVIHSGPTNTGKVVPAMVYDKQLQEGQEPDADLPTITAISAKELTAHLEWALAS